MTDLVVLCGLQASGKSTFYRSRFGATHAHVSKDLLRNNRDPRRRQRELIEAAAREGRSVVVDNTNARREDRVELVSIARALGMRPLLYFFPPDVPTSLERNAAREGKARIPAVAIHATVKRLELPVASEGFAAVYHVVSSAGGFTVSPSAGMAPRDAAEGLHAP